MEETPKKQGGRRPRKMMSRALNEVDGFALFLLRDEVGMKQEVLDGLLGYEGKGSVSKIEHGHRPLVGSELSFYLSTLARTEEDFKDKRALAVLHYKDRLVAENPVRAISEIHIARERIAKMPPERPVTQEPGNGEGEFPPQTSTSLLKPSA